MPETGAPLYRRFADAASAYPTRPAFAFGDGDRTYGELHARAEALAAALIVKRGIAAGEPLALVGEDCADWPTASLAIQAAGAVEVPVSGFGDADAANAFLESEAPRLVFVSGDGLAGAGAADSVRLDAGHGAGDGLAALLESGRAALAADPDVVTRRQATIGPDDPAAIIRTSGTTGPAKRARLSGRNLVHACRHLPDLLAVGPEDVFLSVLPLWHLYGRLVLYTALGSGARLVQAPPRDLTRLLPVVRPTLLPGFPLMWERVHHQTLDRLATLGWRGRIVRAAIALARVYHAGRDRAARGGIPVRAAAWGAAALLYPLWRAADALLLRRLRAPFGGRLRAAIIGDAPLPRAIDVDLRAMGFTLLEGYGSTEQGVSTIRTPHRNRPGTVGRALPDVMLRLVDDDGRAVTPPGPGEIAVAGPQVFPGYAGDSRPARFAEIDGRRFYLTGDIGCLDDAGDLSFVGRRANRLRLRGHEAPVQPEPVESTVLASRYIAHAMLDKGPDGSPWLLVVPDFAQRALAQPGMPPGDPRWVAFYRRLLRRLLRRQERQLRVRVAGFWLADAPLVSGESLTPTLKLRRGHIRARLLPRLSPHPL
ncbi:AMP-dependent synthetase and ligase [Salinisphaera sp. PC39]|uniref:AMP-binding protein n=1 Tax=Salinisphaera sp. PC39 TaxID=1304156 RepID=UPI00333F5F84